MRGDHKTFVVPEHQADSVTIIASPVSGTKYEWRTGESGAGAALGTQKNVRIIGVQVIITWGVTQPTPIEAHLTIDGQPITYSKIDPVTGTGYYIREHTMNVAPTAQSLSSTNLSTMAFTHEGRSVKLECEITWATTQPTNLTMRVKWAKW